MAGDHFRSSSRTSFVFFVYFSLCCICFVFFVYCRLCIYFFTFFRLFRSSAQDVILAVSDPPVCVFGAAFSADRSGAAAIGSRGGVVFRAALTVARRKGVHRTLVREPRG